MHNAPIEKLISRIIFTRRATPLLALAFLLALSCSFRPTVMAREQATLQLTSTSLRQGWIPPSFTCNGAGLSPQLAWSAPPAGTRSFALIVTDPDAPGGTFVHWVLYNLPATARALPAGAPKSGQLADGSRQGRNDFGDTGYGGPCPPAHATHRYVFTLYALDARLNLPAGATRAQVESALQEHTLARGELIGLYRQ
jgi:hypothetical protein